MGEKREEEENGDSVENGEGGETSPETLPVSPIFYDKPVATQEILNGSKPSPASTPSERDDQRAKFLPLAYAVYDDILSSTDPKLIAQRLSAAKDVISDSGPFGHAGTPPAGLGPGQRPAALADLVNAFAAFKDGTVIAIKDMRNETVGDQE